MTAAPRGAGTRRVVAAVATLLLAALAAWCLSRGVVVSSSTGGLLTEPVPRTELRGNWLLGGAVAGTAAVLTALEAASGLARGVWRRSRPEGRPAS